MKKHIFSLFLLCIGFKVYAQDEPAYDFHDEVGLNFTRFIDEAIDLSGESTLLSPYLFSYKRLNEKGDGFRLGTGLNFSRSKGDLTGNFFDDDVKSVNSAFDLRMGKENQQQISERWMYYYGFDVLFGFSNLKVEFDGTKINNENIYGGVGPVLGAQFMISERVGLFTEASFYLTQNFTEERTNFNNGFEPDQNEKANSTNLNFVVPTNIYLFFKF